MVHPDRKANVTSVASIFDELCLPRHTDRLVYRGKGDNYVTLAFDGIGDQSVEMLRWNVNKGQWNRLPGCLVAGLFCFLAAGFVCGFGAVHRLDVSWLNGGFRTANHPNSFSQSERRQSYSARKA